MIFHRWLNREAVSTPSVDRVLAPSLPDMQVTGEEFDDMIRRLAATLHDEAEESHA